MDMPPLFPYVERRSNLYEDGAVIDNLPINVRRRQRGELRPDFHSPAQFRT